MSSLADEIAWDKYLAESRARRTAIAESERKEALAQARTDLNKAAQSRDRVAYHDAFTRIEQLDTNEEGPQQ